MQTQHDHILYQPFISFIIPVHDIPDKLLRECIESIRHQLILPINREIIVVDDGSKHDYKHLLAGYHDEVIYIQQKNGGVSVARNTGLDRATGQYIQFLDGDDRLIAKGYSQVLMIIRESEPDMVLFDFVNDNREISDTFHASDPVSGSEVLLRSNIHGAVWCCTVRREVIGDLRFTPGIAYGEDEEMTPQLLLRSERVIQTDIKAYLYNQRSSSAIHDTSVRKRLKRLDDAKTVISHLNTLALTLKEEQRPALLRRVHQLTMDYLYNVIWLTRSRRYLNRQVSYLRCLGLYPLPPRRYTFKYTLFRLLANSHVGLCLLMWLLPLTKKER